MMFSLEHLPLPAIYVVDTGIPCPAHHSLTRSSGTLPLAGSTPPDGCDDLHFAVSVPSCLPQKNDPATGSAMYAQKYMALYWTLLYFLTPLSLTQDVGKGYDY